VAKLYASLDAPFCSSLPEVNRQTILLYDNIPHSLQLEKCKKDKMLTGQKYKHQNSNTATPIQAGLSALNNPIIGKTKQEIKNTPCTISRYFNNLSIFVCGFTVSPAKNVANDIIA